MKSKNESQSPMTFPLEFAHFAAQPGIGALRVGFVLTMIALAFIVRQPSKTNRKKEDK
jgi:hypothetical protein